jgi:hypothetical protein
MGPSLVSASQQSLPPPYISQSAVASQGKNSPLEGH